MSTKYLPSDSNDNQEPPQLDFLETWNKSQLEVATSEQIRQHHFEKAKNETKLLLDFLRKNGIFVRKAGRLIADEIVNALHEPET
ncbi:hypothetical protein GcC1_125022 [Golovinomyces cichoracearum]|uniref:Uncharacterized protein n=1 Tax=Golovinomyces cichoracearum TaxID=62708 RepID=A0A420I686_9PEZI|nr:hypothetical protein GcC1_125022 [Golovinomyces cichoracearum]